MSSVSVSASGDLVIEEKQITLDGSKDIINGVADWVYEGTKII